MMAACLAGTALPAQDNPSEQNSAQPYPAPLFRVNGNLVQIPVLVLTPAYERLRAPVAADRFSISFAGGPAVRPKFVRQEGDEPIHLAIVLDARPAQGDLLPKIDEAIADLAPSFLRARDTVSIYVIDCGAMHAVEDLPADPTQLKFAVDSALGTWTQRRQLKRKTPCTADAHLWDHLEQVTDILSKQPGWRAILAVTDGDGGKSIRSPQDLIIMAQNAQVTILGLSPSQDGRPNSYVGSAGVTTRGPARPTFISPGLGPTDLGNTPMQFVCELSGGLWLNLYGSNVAKRMQQFVSMLRDRYILEFSRPEGLKPGSTLMKVHIEGRDLFIRPAGDGVPMTDEALTPESPTIPPPASPSTPPAPQPPEVSSAAAPSNEPQPAAPQQAALAPAPPQPESAPESSPIAALPTLKVTGRLTLEDVTVTDEHRIPVHGLEQADFAIKEDGKPQEIRTFEEYGSARPSEQTAQPQLPPNVYSNQQPPPPTTSAVNILLLDSVSTGLANRLARAPENIAYAKQQSLKFLQNMPQGTQVAILQLGGTLKVIQGFTTDRAVLQAAMKSASYEPPGADVEYTPVLSVHFDMAMACTAVNTQSQLVLNGLQQVAAFLSGIKGRKNLLWFTPGIPWLTDYPRFSRVSCINDNTEPLHKTYGLLTAAQVALYPIDPRGLTVNSVGSVDVPLLPRPPAGKDYPRNIGAITEAKDAAFLGSTSEEHASLQDMADATGGASYYNRNDLDGAMGEAIATGSDYYSLSYVPPVSKFDNKYHTIDVKVDRPNLHLQYRPGYTAIDLAGAPAATGALPSTALPAPSMGLLAAMGHGQAASSQILFNVQVTPSSGPAKPDDPEMIGTLNPSLKHVHLVRYDLAYSLSPDQVSLASAPDGTHKGTIDFVSMAYDGSGKMLNVISQTVRITVKPNEVERFMQHPVHVPLQFDLPVGNLFVRVGVLDEPSGRMGTLEIPETVAK
jgi:VWFA-related protein